MPRSKRLSPPGTQPVYVSIDTVNGITKRFRKVGESPSLTVERLLLTLIRLKDKGSPYLPAPPTL